MKNLNQRFAVFWGCAIPYRVPWIEMAARNVLPKLGVEIVDLPFSCCPDPIASKAIDHLTWLSLAARNLALAEEQELDILTLCSGCFETFKITEHELKDKPKRDEVNTVLKKVKRVYQGTTKIFHLMEWLYNEIGVDGLKNRIKRPMAMKVATHTGCHFTRPSDIMQTDNPIYPEQLDELVEAIGYESVDYPDKNLCCGVGVGLVDRQIPKDLVQRKYDGVNKVHADALVAHCPSCIISYDKNNVDGRLPVFHFLEVLGLALGMDRTELAFEEHRIHIPKNAYRM